eukprot:NODE_10_length_2829_cov_90.038129_g8_i0.p5 GENE.NODE_10_length_2829_cov_90.038129_g8_i0~~NODE_10_length_2829_cov_90.038129_g8_i0.p5  ORF type:complete len:65 (+),score=4.60 NODE_10_length_2829_cov_90.038129_g8_i0:719-913(+)
MWKAASQTIGRLAGAAGVVEEKRQHEIRQRNPYADKQREEEDKIQEGFKTPQERADFHQNERDE